MIGGNILGIGLGVMCYPMIKRLFALVKERGKKKVMHTVTKSKQAAQHLARKAQPLLKRAKERMKSKKTA